MNPGPGLAIFGGGHLLHLTELLQVSQVCLHGTAAVEQKLLEMTGVNSLGLGRELEVLSQSFIQPQRHVLEHAVQEGVSELMTQVSANPVSPEGVNEQVLAATHTMRLGYKESPPLGQLGIPPLHEALVAGPILK